MLDLELFVSTDSYENRIAQLDGYVTSLNMVLSEYQNLNSQIGTLITGEDDTDILPELRNRADLQITAIKTQIAYTLECKAQLEKTLENLKESGNLNKQIIQDAVATAKNVVDTAADAARTAASVGQIASLL